MWFDTCEGIGDMIDCGKWVMIEMIELVYAYEDR